MTWPLEGRFCIFVSFSKCPPNTKAGFQLDFLSPFYGDGDRDGDWLGADRDGDGDGNAKWRQEMGMVMEKFQS